MKKIPQRSIIKFLIIFFSLGLLTSCNPKYKKTMVEADENELHTILGTEVLFPPVVSLLSEIPAFELSSSLEDPIEATTLWDIDLYYLCKSNVEQSEK